MKHKEVWIDRVRHCVLNFLLYPTMSVRKQKPGTGPARKRKQMGQPHSSFVADNDKGVPLHVYMDADGSGPQMSELKDGNLAKNRKQRGNRNTKPNKRDNPVGGNQHNKTSGAGNTDKAITAGVQEYQRTKWYVKAVEAGFKNQEALDRFNQAVTAMADHIDPRSAPVCEWCGHSDITLCSCLITNAANAVRVDVVGNVLVLPQGEANNLWRFMWVEKVRRMFVRPSYNPANDVNHNIGWLGNGDLPEADMLLADMLAYIRLNQHSTYIVNGVEDRRAKLAHSKKLALRYLDEKKVPLAERCQPNAVARIHYTVQKATDQPDDAFLFAPVNEKHNITSFVKAPGLNITRYHIIAIASIISPALVRWGVLANMRVNLYLWSRLAILNARILVSGSGLMLKSLTLTSYRALRAIAEDILNGPVPRYCTAIQQWSCNIARTMFTTVSFTDTLRRLLSQVPSIGISLSD